MEDLSNLKRKVERYQEVLQNTVSYRQTWNSSLRQAITDQLQQILKETGLTAEIKTKQKVENLEAIILSLGESKSGIYEKINEELSRHMIKHHGSLVYQQLFNGKIIVMIAYPVIEGYGQPRPPKNIAIYRPEEIKPPFIVRHVEELLKEVTIWEDFDDDEPSQRIGFNLNLMPPVETAELDEGEVTD